MKAKELSAITEKLYAAELRRYSAQVGRPVTIGELKSIRSKYESKNQAWKHREPLASGDGWVVANV